VNAQSRSKPPAQENPLWVEHFECVESIGTWDARRALWPAAYGKAAWTGRTHDRTDQRRAEAL